MATNAVPQGPTDADQQASDLCRSSDLLVALVNTRASESGRVELLGDGAGLARWLTTNGLVDDGVSVTNGDALAAQELRAAFVSLFRSHCGCADAPVDEAEAYLRDIGLRYPLVSRISADGYTLVPAQTGVPGAFGALLAAATDLAARGAWSRLKICKNTSCYGGFFDKTRNSVGQYCSPACGSQMSMRAYRSRLRKSSSTEAVGTSPGH
ncbi:ABATE domain-containing protein [Actinopolymorpha pittospori]|uniref:RNA-binding Zn ribbon-like protein n=1 Tax=Actinopolymorpha pittospori TaxID=648752 RepID=A0A927RMI4_9ACTN|nr:putative RNA-binding Zn ribbon-like protein [Actinopolymorpha pittospori]